MFRSKFHKTNSAAENISKQRNRRLQTSPFSPEEDRATTVGNLHQKFGKDHTCSTGDILVDRQRDTQTY